MAFHLTRAIVLSGLLIIGSAAPASGSWIVAMPGQSDHSLVIPESEGSFSLAWP